MIDNINKADLWLDAAKADSRDAFVSDWALSTIWGDSDDAPIPTERIDYLGRIWDTAQMSIRDIISASGMSKAAFARRFLIPLRTVENWTAAPNSKNFHACPEYIRYMLVQLLGMIE